MGKALLLISFRFDLGGNNIVIWWWGMWGGEEVDGMDRCDLGKSLWQLPIGWWEDT